MKKTAEPKKHTPAEFDKSLIAPCGMNCGTCIAYLREKNRCSGCRTLPTDDVKTRVKCKIKNCNKLGETLSGFCFECSEFPCRRIKNIDTRYRSKYHTSFIENLTMISERGIDAFLAFEIMRRTCKSCGSTLSVHRDNCLTCSEPVNYNE